MAQCTCADPMAIVNALNKNHDEFMQTFYGADMTEDQFQGHSSGGSGGNPTDTGVTGVSPKGKKGIGAAPFRFANWAAPEISNKGENAWSKAWQLAALAIGVLNRAAQADIAKEQETLANQYYDMAKDKLDRFMEKYKPFEIALVDEVRTNPVREMDCADDRKRAQKAVNPSYKRMDKFVSSQSKARHICIDRSFNGFLSFRQALMLVDTENYNLIDDQFYTDYKNDQRWNRRSNVLNLGRNMGAQAMSYGDVARTLSGQLSGQLDKVTGSLMSVVGYFGARNDTYFPNMYLSGYGGMNNQLVSTMNSAGSPYPGSMGVV